ncbi:MULTISPECIES: DUF6427 family protein [Bizionia]|uniref:Beta-carotene 15,15'-monooxygenase n=1 Tax=Bizionia algoritergicola TaxID=291187 RepID=A0A5D0R358_9FLAO|nr:MULTISPECIES: DUF6427 family protein [Bizionia]OBX21845.1 hypothetical protein BAA08_10870 [Bizionia sp. APA-3]TYB75058.1 hypothetical protein ES675_02690 [Bizionia algoritergicola]
MISKFFRKAKPIHFVIMSMVLFIGFLLAKLRVHPEFNAVFVLKQLALFGVCVLSLFIFDFFTSKNRLSKKNSYNLLFYGLFMVLMFQTFLNTKLVIANLFILLALRRIVSLRSKKENKKKILDATIWISLATLLFFWSSLFFIVLFAALFLYGITDVKNWIIPFIGVLLVAILTYAVLIVFNIDFWDYVDRFESGKNFDFSMLNNRQIIIAATIYFSYFIWSLFYYLRTIKNQSKSYRPSYLLILFTAFIALVIIIISPEKSGAEFIFLIAPLALIVTNYIELVPERWFREVLIWLLIVGLLASLVL